MTRESYREAYQREDYDEDYDYEYDQEQNGRRRRRRKRKSHRLYAFIVLLLGTVILVLAVVLVFYVQRVDITGNEYCTDKQIAELVQSDKYSVNSLYVCARYALGRGEVLPCFERMKVSLGLPWVLKVEVKEKQIVGCVLTEEQQYAYFDKDGLIVKMDGDYLEGIPCVEGIDTDKLKLYKRIESEDSKIFEEILEASQELKRHEMSADKIVCKNDRIYAYVGQLCISLGNDVTSEKIAQISPIIEKLEGKSGTLHLENYTEGRETITFSIDEFPE